MFSLIIGTALAVASPTAAQIGPQESSATCTAERLRPFVGPTGIRPSWPLAAELPSHLASSPGLVLSDPGNYQDGYSHWLFVDLATRTSYVVQRGGFAGTQTVFGPLPVANCSPAPPNNSFNPMPLRGTG